MRDHAGWRSGQSRKGVAAAHRFGVRPRHGERLFDDLDAFALQHVGKARVVLDVGVIECGDSRLRPDPSNETPAPRSRAARGGHKARCDRAVRALADGWCRRGAPARGNYPRQRLDERHRNALLHQRERQAKPDGPGADNNHAVAVGRHRPATTKCRKSTPRSRFNPAATFASNALSIVIPARITPDRITPAPLQFAAYGFATTSLAAPVQPLWVRSNTTPLGSRYFAS